MSFYIINYNEGGFVLLSADKRAQPIIGFSENDNFLVDFESMPEGLQFWIDDTKKQITDIQNSDLKQSEKDKNAWGNIQEFFNSQNLASKIDEDNCTTYTEIKTVGPLLNTIWHQTGGYNDALPFINCNGNPFQVYAGCVPIAMAQVMKYFEHPTTYNWSNMPANYGTTTTANFINDIHNEISTMYDGVPNPLSYYCNSTGVSSGANMGSVLRHDFNYTSADWSNYYYPTVVNNIDNGKPVILSSSNSSSGHMWVCDGYKDIDYYFEDCTGIGYLYLHMNWGWNTAYTNYNGWFAFNNFNPINSYNSNKKMIYNITP